MKDNIRKLYNDWLEDTIQADVPYQLDPAVDEQDACDWENPITVEKIQIW